MMKVLAPMAWFTLLLAALLTSLSVSWNFLASYDYGFPLFYDAYDVELHINKFAPQNDYILGLDQVDRGEHQRLFAEIVYGVHHQGEGLSEISFSLNDEQIRLLRVPEVIHLEDVANLIDVFQGVGIGSVCVFLALAGLLVHCRVRPNWRQQLAILTALVVIAVVVVFAVGPKEVFYQMHVWMFPDDHEWFFYYQDSLMTTLMKAPQIFGGIAATIVVGGALIFVVLIRALYQIIGRFHSTTPDDI